MWHEARKQEKKIRGMLVDFRRRAERRQDFYERIKADPTQFMQIHGRKCKVHLDPSVAALAENPAIMMPWQGQQDNIIDRFDGRAHLDFIPPIQKEAAIEEAHPEERQANYERYRILAQNEFLNITEEKFLQQLYLEEQFGANAQVEFSKRHSQKPPASSGAAIGYTYEDSSEFVSSNSCSFVPGNPAPTEAENNDSDLEDLDVDVSINITKLDTTQANELNKFGRNYGMKSNDFYSYLTKDADEADAMRMAKEEEQEKIMFSGRKSRRERRAQREKKFSKRFISPPSYAAKDEDEIAETTKMMDDTKDDDSNDESRSPSPVNSGKITYITSFGGEEEPAPLPPPLPKSPNSKLAQLKTKLTLASALADNRPMTYAEKVKQNLEKLKEATEKPSQAPQVEIVGKPIRYQRGNRSRSRSRGRYRRSHSRQQRRRSRSRSGGRSKRRRSYSSRSSRSSSSSSSSSSDNRRRKRQRSPIGKRSRSPLARKRSSSTTSSSSSSTTSSSSHHSSSKSKSLNHPSSVSKQPPSEKTSPKILSSTIPEIVDKPEVQESAAGPVKRYYGRKKEGAKASSGSELSFSDSEVRDDELNSLENRSPASSNPASVKNASAETKSGSATASSSSCPLNLRDRLKRKMQSLLNKQYKADKKAEFERSERQSQLQQEREDEMRELALKLRKRQRELRHKYGSQAHGSGSGSSSGEDNEEFKKIVEADFEEERQIQSRLNKLLALSRNEEKDQSERHSSSSKREVPPSRHTSEQHSRRPSPDRRESRHGDNERRRRSSSRFNRSPSRDNERRRRHSPSHSSSSHRYNKKLVDY